MLRPVPYDTPAPTTVPLPAGMSPGELARRVDPWIAGAMVLLLGVSAVLVYSASAVRAIDGGSGSLFLTRHLSMIGFGLVVVTVILRIPVERWSRFAYLLLGLAFLLLVMLYVPGLGRSAKGALRWIQVGPLGFQPAELAKLALVVYLAHSLAKKREAVTHFSVGFLPHVLVASAFVGLIIIQPDLGSSMVIYGVMILMLFVAGTRVGYLALGAVAALPVFIYYVSTHQHAMKRLLVFLNPEPYAEREGYQLMESLVSFGSGQLTGTGLGAGPQKLYFLPESHTDFIFAVIGQELGFIGTLVVILAFAVIVGRGLWLASKMSCRFPMLLSFGISAWIGVQAVMNMAVVMALVPTKGMTLPLVSYGRSSMLISMVGVGILLRATAEHVSQERDGRLLRSRAARPFWEIRR